GSDVVRLSASGALQIQLTDVNGVAIGSPVAASAGTPAILSLNERAAGTYFLKIFGAGSTLSYELSPGDRPTERTIVESQTADGLVRQEVRTVRQQADAQLDLSGRQTSFLDLSSLEAGTEYLLRVISPNRVPTAYNLSFDLADDLDPADNVVNLAAKADVTRRDVILGGAGNDALQGGAGEDWIFGGTGNDVLTGGYDRMAEDLLFGGEGDDSFQLLPDELPFIKGTSQTYIPTLTDRFDGGPGTDRVLFLGGDLDNLSRPVNDDVAIRWNRFLQRYEFTALSWDTNNQSFVVEQQALNASGVGPLAGFTGDVEFRVRVPDPAHPDRGFVTVQAHIDATTLTGVAEDLQVALNAVFGADADGLPNVAVEFPGNVLRLRAKGTGLELRTDESNAMHTVLGFDALTTGSPIYHQTYAFYQTISVEKTVIDTRAGDDVVHAEPEFMYPNVPSEWGIKPGDYEQRALIGALEIHGGDGNDRIFGGALGDTIFGGAGADVIFGGGGDDAIDGGPGRDLLVGNTSLAPDAYEFNARNGVLDRNDLVGLAANLPSIRAGTTIDGLNFDLDDGGDWYVISAAEAQSRFGNASGALLTGDMIDVLEVVQNEGGVVPTGEKLRAFLFAAENIAAEGEPLDLVPRERFSGVPEFYLLHVTNELEPSATTAGKATALDGVDDVVRIGPSSDIGADLQRHLTLELWFKLDAGIGNPDGSLNFGPGKVWMPLVYKGDEESATAAERAYSLWINQNGLLHFTSANGSAQDGVANTAAGVVKAGQWIHFAGVMDRETGTMRAYVNGVLAGTGTVGGLTAAAAAHDDRLLIGQTAESDASYTPFKGAVDELRLWSTARSDNEIARGYQRILQGDEENLAGYWRFEEPEGASFADRTANGNNATLSVGTLGNLLLSNGHVTGQQLITPFGTGLYQIRFNDQLGQTVHVGEDEALQVLPAVQLGGQPVMIALGDVDGDGFGDAIVSIRDRVSDGTGSGGFRHFARLAFGGADGTLDQNKYGLP
ncbi:MAG TPA: LamG-like jellyroll fold domain-containing protein, partial [Candidatus Limnocylindrales bacterium]